MLPQQLAAKHCPPGHPSGHIIYQFTISSTRKVCICCTDTSHTMTMLHQLMFYSFHGEASWAMVAVFIIQCDKNSILKQLNMVKYQFKFNVK